MRKPFFHVLLGDGEQWLVEVEWPDGTLERIRSFRYHASAADWVAKQSEAWLQTQGLFNDEAI
jgi:hypothetical protein